jgi:hypothetical protein
MLKQVQHDNRDGSFFVIPDLFRDLVFGSKALGFQSAPLFAELPHF